LVCQLSEGKVRVSVYSVNDRKEKKMKINTEITISNAEINTLAEILQCAPKDVPDILSKYSASALREYVDMISGKKVFKRGSDMLEYRLLLMIEEVFGNLIPEENTVSNIFQTTTSESRSLIRAIMSKYQYQLKIAIESSLRYIVKNSKQETAESDYTVVINSQNLVDELNLLLAQIDGNLPLVSKQRGSVSTFVIKPSSYKKLKEKLSIR
jgi:uncharacterized protein involved in tolerance to divalent cations